VDDRIGAAIASVGNEANAFSGDALIESVEPPGEKDCA
jgi:hypothetical protein